MYSVLYYTIHKVFAEPTAVSRLEELFRLEIDFQRRLRTAGAGAAEAAELHTSYALAAGYEPLMRALRGVTAEEIERLDQQFAGTGDPRDLMAARASLQQFLVNRNADI